MKRVEPIPSEKATEVASAATREEWLEGIPPVFHMRVAAISRVDLRGALRRTITTFKSWATNQLVSDERKTGFSTNEASIAVRWVMIEDIALQSLRERAFVKG